MLRNKLMMGYLLLVGAPLLILFSASQAGKGLTAPPAVSGDWILVPAANSQPAGNCSGLLAAGKQPFLTIAQSGTDLTLTLNDRGKTRFQGSIEAAGIEATGNWAGPVPGCGGGTAIRLRATVDGPSGDRSLRGELRLDGCGGCPPAPFVATRKALSQRKGE